MNVSIILVNYNTRALTVDCINSIYKQTKGVKFEIIVVDNASADDSCEAISKEHPKVVLIKSPENLGFGRANNLGIEVAKGEYIFLLNSDTILLNNAVKLFYDYAEANNNRAIGAFGALLLGQDEKLTHSYGKFISIHNTLLKTIPYMSGFLERREIANVKKQATIEVDYITGADLFMPRSVIDCIGYFDPRFFMYCEEVDLQYRMHQNGFKRIVISGPRIIHLEGASYTVQKKRWSYNRMSNYTTSLIIYIKKHNNSLKYCIFRILFAFMRMITICFSDLKMKQKLNVFKLLLSR